MAREQAERLKTGGIVVFPNSRDESGYQWDWSPPAILGNATEIREYPKDLDIEISRGLGIPDSVLTDPSGTGSYAGRRVPERAFYISLEHIISELVSAIKTQIIDPLIKLNFEGKQEYEIITKPLVEVMSPEASAPAGFNQGVQGMPGNNATTIGNIFSGDENPNMDMGLSGGTDIGAPAPQSMGMSLKSKTMAENYIHSNKKPVLGIGLDSEGNIIAKTRIRMSNKKQYEKGQYICPTDVEQEVKNAGFINGLDAVIKIGRFSLLNRDTANTLFNVNAYQLSLIKNDAKLNQDVTEATYSSVQEAWEDICKISWLTPGLAYAIYKKYGGSK